jgi:hypothetical protein
MAEIAVGQEIRVPCKVQPGPFSEEYVVTIDTIDGPISGFVREENLIKLKSEWYARGVVREIRRDTILVWIKGSFFTTNGLANVSRHLARAA